MITAIFVFLISSLYALSPLIPGGIDPSSPAADIARTLGPFTAGLAMLSAFPSARAVRFVNVIAGTGLIFSPFFLWDWSPTALVIQTLVGLWMTGFSLLPRDRDRVCADGGWRHVLSSPSTIDRIETAAEL